MGRTKKDDSSSSATKAVDAKSKAIEKAKMRQTRERAQKSYREHSESEESEKEVAFKDEEVKFSDEEVSVSESGSDWAGESSGSEYGKKKSKGKRGKAVARGRGRKPAASPKGRGRGRPAAAAKGKAKAKASPASSRNGNRKAAAKRYRDDSESESEAASSGSEYGKRAKPSPKKSPAKPAPAPSARGGRGRPKASAKSYKEISEDDFSEEEVPKKSAAKKFKKDESEEEQNKSDESVSEKSENESKPTKATPKPKARATASKPSKNGEEEEDGLDDEKPADKKKPKESEESASAGSESEEEKPKEKPKEKPAPKTETKNGDKEGKAKKDEEDDEEDDDISEEEEEEEEEEEKKEKKSEPAPLKNKTDTDFDSIDFECTKKSSKGDAWNFKISCWNIGGIKSWVKKNGLDYLKHENPDVMCLQEIKCSDKTKPPEVKSISGYPFTYWEYAEQSGHHGVAILSKTEPKKVTNGLPIEESDSDEDKKAKEKFNLEGRLLTAEYEHFHLVNAYVPNGGRGVPTEKFPKGYPPKVANGERQEFDKLLRVYVKNLDEKKPVILTGDLNVSHAEIDLANPKTNSATAGFTKEEREGMTQLLEETKLFDSFRELYPDKKAAYTFWSYMHNARQKNVGWRLDYFLLSDKLKESLCENLMRTEVYGSDHCPLVLFIKV